MSSRPPLITGSSSREPRANITSFDVTVVGATGLPRVGDFYVKLGVDGATMLSTAISHSQSPQWNKSFSLLSNNAEPRLVLEVYRKRHLRADEVVGRVLHVVTLSQDGEPRTFKETVISTKKGSIVGLLEFVVKTKPNEDLTAARAAVKGLKAPGVVQKVGDAIEGIDNATSATSAASEQLQAVQAAVSPLVVNLRIFVNLVAAFSKVHPYAQAAWEIISVVYKVYDRQMQMDDKVRGLFDAMNALYIRIRTFQRRKGYSGSEVLDVSEDVLLRVAKQTVDCSYFIQDYCSRSFTGRLVQHIVKSADSAITEYKKAFDSMEKEFERNVFEGTYIVTTVILDEVKDLHVRFELQKLPIVDGASLVVSIHNPKHCLPGTRIDVLTVITDWANALLQGSESQRILLLTGLAGSGKSTIAHTIASRFHAIGRLGGSFASDRKNKTRRIDQLFPHIARLVAGLGGAVQKALAEVISHNEELLAVTDLREQFSQLLVEVLKDLTISGPIVIVIDAIDEASDGTDVGTQQLEELIGVITELASALPPNIRIIITSRPEERIIEGFKGCPEVVHKDLNSFPAHNDVLLYVQDRLLHRPRKRLAGIDEECSRRIAEKSQGLFYFAFLVCNEITNPKLTLPRKTYERIIGSDASVEQTGLLDSVHMSTLKAHFNDESSTDFVAVMSFILALQEPVSASTLHSLWEASGRDLEVLDSVLNRTRSLLDGVDDTTKNIQLSHTSFRDFMIDPVRSGKFHVKVAAAHKALVFACIRIMNNQLAFNMCNLESSYPLNKEVRDLSDRVRKGVRPECSYASQFWAEHLKLMEMVNELFGDMPFQDALKVFLTEKLLFWLEVLSVLNKMSVALPSISVLNTRLTDDGISHLIENIVPLSLTKDAQEFIRLCAPVGSLSTPHIYLSALSFIPPTSSLSKLYCPRFPHIPKVVAPSVLKATSVRNTIRCPDVVQAAVSPDGMLIAANSGKDIVLFNIHTGERVGAVLRGHETYINGLQFSPHGSTLASCSFEATIRLWDVKTQKAVGEPLRGHTDMVQSIAWARDGQRLVSGSDDCTVRAWDTSSGGQIWCSDGKTAVSSLAYSPDGTLIATAGGTSHFDITLLHSDGTVACELRSEPMGFVNSVAFSPDGRRLASGSKFGTIWVWDVQTREVVSETLNRPENFVPVVAFSPDGTCVASVSFDGTLRLWNPYAKEPGSEKVLGSSHSRSLAFSPDGTYIVTTESQSSITIWDAGWHATEDYPVHHTDRVTCLTFPQTGQQVISGSSDKSVRVWDSTTGREVGQPLIGLPGSVTAIAISPDATSFVSGSARTLILRNMATLQCIGGPMVHNGPGGVARLEAVCFSEDGKKILMCLSPEIVIWDVDSRTSLVPDDFYPGSSIAAFGPDRNLLVVAQSFEDDAVVWDITKHDICSQWSTGEEGASSIAVSHDGSTIALGHNSGHVSVWDMSGEKLQLFEEHDRVVVTVTFASGSKHLASGSYDTTVHIMDVESGKGIGSPIQCGDAVLSLAFSANATRLASGLQNGHIQIWDVSTPSLSSGSGYTGSLLFSYNTANALPNPEMLFQPNYPPDDDIRDHVRMDSNGFVVADVENEDRILFWVPGHLRNNLLFLRRQMILQLGEPVELDLSQFVHGSEWTKCYSLLP